MHRLTCLLAGAVFAVSNAAWSASMTEFGGFGDFFGEVVYSSADVFDPDAFKLPGSAPVVGVAKFDPSLGTLDDIIITIDVAGMPIMLEFGGPFGTEGGIDAAADDSSAVFEADGAVFGEAGLFYTGPAGTPPDLFVSVLTDVFDLTSACDGPAGADPCSAPLGVALTDDVIEGTISVISFVDTTDFVGAGELVDTLAVGLFIQTAADFDDLFNINVEDFASLAVKYDVFAAGPGISVTYLYTPVPLPAPLLLLCAGIGVLLRFGRRV